MCYSYQKELLWEQSPEVLECTTIWSGSSTKSEHIQSQTGQAMEGVMVYHRYKNNTAQDKQPHWSNWKPTELNNKRLGAYKLKYDMITIICYSSHGWLHQYMQLRMSSTVYLWYGKY